MFVCKQMCRRECRRIEDEERNYETWMPDDARSQDLLHRLFLWDRNVLNENPGRESVERKNISRSHPCLQHLLLSMSSKQVLK
jgi:hypothetical protein